LPSTFTRVRAFDENQASDFAQAVVACIPKKPGCRRIEGQALRTVDRCRDGRAASPLYPPVLGVPPTITPAIFVILLSDPQDALVRSSET